MPNFVNVIFGTILRKTKNDTKYYLYLTYNLLKCRQNFRFYDI